MVDCLSHFMPPGELRDGDLLLQLADFSPHPLVQVPTYHFRMVHAATAEELGMIRLRVGSLHPLDMHHLETYHGHIGYGVHAPHRGHRYAARSVRLLVPFARSLGIDPLWITCDPENAASRRTLELAGAQFVEIVNVPEDSFIFQNGHPRKCRYRL
jgi:tagatose 1,6-diphosphate aldolase